MKLLSIGSESPHSVFTKIDIKGSTTLGMIKIVPIFYLKREIPLIFKKKDPFLKMVQDQMLGRNLKCQTSNSSGGVFNAGSW